MKNIIIKNPRESKKKSYLYNVLLKKLHGSSIRKVNFVISLDDKIALTFESELKKKEIEYSELENHNNVSQSISIINNVDLEFYVEILKKFILMMKLGKIDSKKLNVKFTSEQATIIYKYLKEV